MELHRYVSRDGRVELDVKEKKTTKSVWFERATNGQVRPARHLLHRKAAASDTKPNDVPPPRLSIAIHIVGSRGDVQPFIPIAQLLSRPPYNHRVRICTHPVFRKFVEENGLEFFSIGGDPESLMAYMVKNPGLLPGKESIRDGDIGKRRKEMAEIIDGGWRSCHTAGSGEGPALPPIDVADVKDLFLADAIIANPPSYAHVHCAEKLGIPLHIVFTMPWSPTHEFSHPLASFASSDANARTMNFHSFGVMELLAWQGLGDIINKFRVDTLKLSEVSPLWGFILLNRLRVPHSYCWSRALIPKPNDWADHLDVTGFSFLKLASSYTPPKDLIDFLGAGPKPIYIGFGSIVVKDPKALTELVLEAVRKARVRAIISRGWGGVGGEATPENVYFIGNCPHDWLFQHVSAVVHHGGAGTTAAGIAAGKPTVIVPFFGDQPFWANMVWRAGAGPKPVPFKQMTADTLAESIRTSQQPEIQAAVEEMQRKIAAEDGARDTVLDFHKKLGSDRIRCQVCPDRVATWNVKMHGKRYRLSNRAMAVLYQNKLIDPIDRRLAHNIHWDVDEGAEAPLIGLVAAAGSVAHGVVKSVETFKQRLRTSRAVSRIPKEERSSFVPPKQREKPSASDIDALRKLPAIETFDRDRILLAANRMAANRYSSRPFESEEETAARRARRSRAMEAAASTAALTRDLLKVGLRAPVTSSCNFANGCHNLAAFIMSDSKHAHKRRRQHIEGFQTGVKAGAKASAYGFYDAFAGLVQLPYEGCQTSGARGVARGFGRALLSLPLNLGAAVSSIPAYTLKGLEREIHKRRLSKLEADFIIIRIRQCLAEWQSMSEEEKEAILKSWNGLVEKQNRSV